MAERGIEVDRSTINHWVLDYALELDRRGRPYLKLTNGLWRVDETYIEVKGVLCGFPCRAGSLHRLIKTTLPMN